MPVMSTLILSSMALKRRASSLSSSSAPTSGTRASMRPVSMARTVSMSPWMGFNIRRARMKPAASPISATGAMMPAKITRNCLSSCSRSLASLPMAIMPPLGRARTAISSRVLPFSRGSRIHWTAAEGGPVGSVSGSGGRSAGVRLKRRVPSADTTRR